MPNLKIPSRTPLRLSLMAGLWAFASHAQAYSEQGRLHDTASWRSDEFTANWGLAAIGADAAYARGLSGVGVRLSLADTGTDCATVRLAQKIIVRFAWRMKVAKQKQCLRPPSPDVSTPKAIEPVSSTTIYPPKHWQCCKTWSPTEPCPAWSFIGTEACWELLTTLMAPTWRAPCWPTAMA